MDAPDIRPLLISGIWPDTGFDLPDIRPDTRYQILIMARYPAKWYV
jgi:hypothetical protein